MNECAGLHHDTAGQCILTPEWPSRGHRGLDPSDFGDKAFHQLQTQWENVCHLHLKTKTETDSVSQRICIQVLPCTMITFQNDKRNNDALKGVGEGEWNF